MLHAMRRAGAAAALFVLSLACAPATRAAEAPRWCGIEIPPDQAIGFVPLPEGDVFCPLIADPKAASSFVSYVRGTSSSALGTDLGSVGIGDRFPIARWGGPRPGEGVQVGLEGAVFAQFDMRTRSDDLVNADYLVGVPVTFRRGPVSVRVRLYHQSSHLGDEYLLRANIQRENFSYESLEGLVSGDLGPLRVYGGGENVFGARPGGGGLDFNLAHGGVELRQPGRLLPLSRLANVRLVAGGDVKAVEALDWELGWSARAGFEFVGPGESAHAARLWSLLAEYYDGPSPYGQFFRSDVKYYGLGLRFDL